MMERPQFKRNLIWVWEEVLVLSVRLHLWLLCIGIHLRVNKLDKHIKIFLVRATPIIKLCLRSAKTCRAHKLNHLSIKTLHNWIATLKTHWTPSLHRLLRITLRRKKMMKWWGTFQITVLFWSNNSCWRIISVWTPRPIPISLWPISATRIMEYPRTSLIWIKTRKINRRQINWKTSHKRVC